MFTQSIRFVQKRPKTILIPAFSLLCLTCFSYIAASALITASAPLAGSGGNRVPKMYWVDHELGRIQRANLDGSNVETVVTFLGTPAALEIDSQNGYLFWTDFETDKVQRSDLDGDNIIDISTGVESHVLAIDAANGHVYYRDHLGDTFERSNFDGSGRMTLFFLANLVTDLVLDLPRGHMYWLTATDDIFRANLDGSQSQSITIPNIDNIDDLVLDTENEDFYVEGESTDAAGIYSLNYDGSSEGVVVENVSVGELELDLDNGKIYWTDWNTDKVQRANLDGSQVEDLLVNVGQLNGMALDLDVCHSLDAAVIGSGTLDLSPPNSSDCPANHFLPGDVVTLNAEPANGWQVEAWLGSDADGSTANNNSLTMPDRDEVISVTFVEERPAGSDTIYLPIILYDLLQETEPNNTFDTATGPLRSGVAYVGFPNDAADFFYFDLTRNEEIVVTLNTASNHQPQLQLFNSNQQRECFEFVPPYHVRLSGSPGRYYIFIFTPSTFNYNQQDAYSLTVYTDGSGPSGGSCE